MELRTQLSSGALCAVRGESAEQTMCQQWAGSYLLKEEGEKYHKLN